MPEHYRKPRDKVSIYDQLATIKLSDVTSKQLNDASKSTFVQGQNLEFWKGPITLARIIESSRTYAFGLPIPEQGSVLVTAIADGASAANQPAGTELFEVLAISAAADSGTTSVTVSLTDGAAQAVLATQGSIGTTAEAINLSPTPNGRLIISNSLYLAFNVTGDATTISVAYQVVSQ
jgi:hypothetical protein